MILQSIERVYSNLEIKFNENTPQSYKLNKDILKTNKKIVTYRTTVKLIPK